MTSQNTFRWMLATCVLASGVSLAAQDVQNGEAPAPVPQPAPVLPQESVADRVARIVEQLESDVDSIREAAQKKLDELGEDACELLKKYADDARQGAKVDLELRLRNALQRFEKKIVPENPPSDDTTPSVPGRITLRFSSRSFSSSSDGQSKTVTSSDNGKTTTITKDKDGKITAKITDDNATDETKKNQTLEFKNEAELKEKRPDLHKILNGGGGIEFKVIPFSGPDAPKAEGDKDAEGETDKADENSEEDPLDKMDEVLRKALKDAAERRARMLEEHRRIMEEMRKLQEDMDRIMRGLKEAGDDNDAAPPKDDKRDEGEKDDDEEEGF